MFSVPNDLLAVCEIEFEEMVLIDFHYLRGLWTTVSSSAGDISHVKRKLIFSYRDETTMEDNEALTPLDFVLK
jgi:hypothetical protein